MKDRDDVAEFQLLSSLRDDLISGQKESAESVGLDPAPYAVFGLLDQHLGDGSDGNGEKQKDLATVVFETLDAEAVIDWTSKDDVQREMKRKVKRQLRLADCPTDTIDELTTAIMDLARVRLG